jgi:hypothetical protein
VMGHFRHLAAITTETRCMGFVAWAMWQVMADCRCGSVSSFVQNLAVPMSLDAILRAKLPPGFDVMCRASRGLSDGVEDS